LNIDSWDKLYYHEIISTKEMKEYMGKLYEEPNADEMLWRYMDLSKLISLISTENLFFSAADRFDDKHEGARGNIKDFDKWKQYLTDTIKQDEEFPIPKEQIIDAYIKISQHDRTHTFINCWHSNSVESEAMWKLYSKDITNAVAIQTTYQRLRDSFKNYKYMPIGKVRYDEYNDIIRNLKGTFWVKRKSFEYENEVRAILHIRKYDGLPGISVPVDIDVLIENIYISPYAPDWFIDVVKSILNKYSVEKEVYKSNMLIESFY
jgi:hypothetical protein